MNNNVQYLMPKKTVSQIARERGEAAQQQNIDVYEAIAGLFEELATLAEQNALLGERVTQLEGGQNK